MEEVMLATDVVLSAIISPTTQVVDKLIEQAKRGEIALLMPHFVLYCALYSVEDSDVVNSHQLAELLKYVQIVADAPEFLGPQERGSWTPSVEEVANWRRCALS